MTYLLSKALTVYIVVSTEDSVITCRRTTFNWSTNSYVPLEDTNLVVIPESQIQLLTESRETLDREINLMESS